MLHGCFSAVLDSRRDEQAGQALRLTMMTTPPTGLGITPSSDFPSVYGAVMDWPVSKTTSVAALSDGNASLYTTSTFGIIGGVGNEAVRDAARARS